MSEKALKKRLSREIEKVKILEKIVEDKTREIYLAMKGSEEESVVKSDFLSRMSHEIRTPLNGIIGMTSLLLQDEHLTDKQRHYMDIMEQSCDSLLSLVNEILDYSKLRSHMMKLENISFDLEKLSHELYSAMYLMAEEKNLEMCLEYKIGTPNWIYGDPRRIRQILANLISNALKFTEEGCVTITVERIEIGELEKLKICVKDTGPGIPEDFKDKLFKEFTQADTSYTRKHEGAGLGLAITNQLALLMNGCIKVENIPSGGSDFCFTIPLKVDESKNKPFELPEVLKPLRILIVYSGVACANNLKDFMNHSGVNCHVCYDPMSAIEKLKEGIKSETPYDMVVINHFPPELDAFAIAKSIKKDPQLQDLVLIFVGTAKKNYDEKLLKKHRFSGKFFRPISSSNLIRALETTWIAHSDSLAPEEADGISLEQQKGKSSAEKKILIAEDDRLNQEVIESMLNSLGYEIEIAKNGREAVEKWETTPYEMILMDIKMPVLNGIDAAKIIREHEKETDSHTPIVALTAQIFESTKKACQAAGIDAFLPKPLKVDDLQKCLDQYAPRP